MTKLIPQTGVTIALCIETLLAQGIQPEYGSGPKFGVTLKDESEKWSELIDQAKIKF